MPHGELTPRPRTFSIRSFRRSDAEAVVELWHQAGLTRPWNDPYKDIERKLEVQRNWFLVAVAERRVIGTVMAGYDGHRGWVNYLAVAPGLQRQGIGRGLMREAERLLHGAGCPKVNLQVRSSNKDALGFYEALGYHLDDVVSLGLRLEVDEAPRNEASANAARQAG